MDTPRLPPLRSLCRRALPGLALALLCAGGSGCAALTNPLVESVPVRRVAPELLASPPLEQEETIPLSLLEHPPADAYRLAAGDVLGVWVEGVVGDKATPIPVHVPLGLAPGGSGRQTPSLGYPFTVRPDGTVHLPLVPPVPVAGLTAPEAEDAVRKAYLTKGILPAGRERVFVTHLQQRRHEVVVMRQESTAFGLASGGGGFAPTGKRGTGHLVELPAYQNDVLHALALSGGLPGLDAYNEVVVFRRAAPGGPGRDELLKRLDGLPPGAKAAAGLLGPCPVVRIPLRREPGKPLPFRPEDVVLQTGDVVFLEARDRDVFYTGGLLPAGEFVLPRDRTLDVVEAVSLVRGPLVNGTFSNNNLSGNLVQQGIGSPSARLLVVLRKTAGGGQVPIRVDLNQALRDPRERIAVRPGDLLVLQEQPGDAMARYFTQTFFNFELAWTAIRSKFLTGVVDIAGPDRLSAGRVTIPAPGASGVRAP